MDKQTTAAFILIGLILVVWLYINAPEPQPQLPATTSDSTIVNNDSLNPTEVVKENNNLVSEIQSDTNSLPSLKEEKIVTIETDLVKLELTSHGGRIRKYYLKEFETWYHRDFDESDFYNTHVQLINDKGDFNIVFVTKDGRLVNTANVEFETNADNYFYKISGEETVSLVYEFSLSDTQKVKKTFSFSGNKYASNVDIELIKAHLCCVRVDRSKHIVYPAIGEVRYMQCKIFKRSLDGGFTFSAGESFKRDGITGATFVVNDRKSATQGLALLIGILYNLPSFHKARKKSFQKEPASGRRIIFKNL